MDAFLSLVKPVCMLPATSINAVASVELSDITPMITELESLLSTVKTNMNAVTSKIDSISSTFSGRRRLLEGEEEEEEHLSGESGSMTEEEASMHLEELADHQDEAEESHAKYLQHSAKIRARMNRALERIRTAAELEASKLHAELLASKHMWDPKEAKAAAAVVSTNADDNAKTDDGDDAAALGLSFNAAFDEVSDVFLNAVDLWKAASFGFFLETSMCFSFQISASTGQLRQGDVLATPEIASKIVNPIVVNLEVALFYGFSVKIQHEIKFSFPYFLYAKMDASLTYLLKVDGSAIKVFMEDGVPKVVAVKPAATLTVTNGDSVNFHMQVGFGVQVTSHMAYCFGGTVCSGPKVVVGQTVFIGVDMIAAVQTAKFVNDECLPTEFALSTKFVDWDYPAEDKTRCGLNDGEAGQVAATGTYIRVPQPTGKIGVTTTFPALITKAEQTDWLYQHSGDDFMMEKINEPACAKN